ncbi:hypothetical protein [Nocardia iowensis]|uniref:Uncharacterized protein n=1 Tax=Nocardia iowensis TaxID=204891 RepID=A0ABX8S458_NOCIO|nr:hypothetical protein [Nocardia iowensis]QXN94666.1 hypothetical protein KV110_17390 [Nocardia iowensis]
MKVSVASGVSAAGETEVRLPRAKTLQAHPSISPLTLGDGGAGLPSRTESEVRT